MPTKRDKRAAEVIESYKVVYRGGSGESVEKKSRFIADMRPISDEEEALASAEEIRKKYWDARHHCFAYIIGDGEQTTRCSDDGEPSQTAGKSMMDVPTGEDLHDICAVIIRYFGGALLGMGGLVRAYLGVIKVGLKDCMIVEEKLAARLKVTTSCNGSGKIQYTTVQADMDILDVRYTDKVVFMFLMPVSEEGRLRSQVTEGTNGCAHIKKVDEVYCSMGRGELIVS